MKNAIVYHFEKPSIVNEVLYWGSNKKQTKEIKEKVCEKSENSRNHTIEIEIQEITLKMGCFTALSRVYLAVTNIVFLVSDFEHHFDMTSIKFCFAVYVHNIIYFSWCLVTQNVNRIQHVYSNTYM